MTKKIAKFILCTLTFMLYSCSNDSDYKDMRQQESKVLTRTKQWLISEQHVQEKDLNWSSAIIYQKDTEDSYTAIIPVRMSNDFTLQRIVLQINPYNITGELWDFKFKYHQSINELQKLSTHKIMENFTGDLKILNLESLEIKKSSFITGNTDNILITSKTSGTGVCNNCHGADGAINLDPVVVTGPGGDPWPNPITDPKPTPDPPILGGGGPGSGSSMPPPPDTPINDIKKFLECFLASGGANLTVYAEKIGISGGVGHAFIGISQGGNTAVYGYYPKNGYLSSLTGPGIMGENGGHLYDVSASMNITGAQLQQIINLSQSYQNQTYDISFNNCSDFAIDVLNIAGISTSGWVATPNSVANILSGLANHTSGSNNAPKSKKTCP
jgi:hypothetical protein